MTQRALWLTALAAFLAFPGCGGGCGETPQDQSSAQTPNSAPSAGGGGGSSGSGTVNMSRFDSAKAGQGPQTARQQADETAPAPDALKPRTAAAAPSASTTTAASPAPAVAVRKVALEDLPQLLKGSQRSSLIVERAAGCADCRVADGAVFAVSPDFADRYDFLSVDMTDSGGDATRLPVFLLYQGSKQVGRRVGMPFARAAAVDGQEGDASYQKRVAGWLHDALAQGSFQPAGAQ